MIRVGIIEVSRSALLLAAWLLYRDNCGIMLQGLLACMVHEFGHLCILWLNKISVKRISITITGAQIVFSNTLSYVSEIAAALAGPGVNFLLAALFCQHHNTQCFAGINFALAMFNLLPVGQLDGARILRCVLSIISSERISYAISGCLDIYFTAFFSCLGTAAAVMFHNPTLFFVSIWLVSRLIREKNLKKTE